MILIKHPGSGISSPVAWRKQTRFACPHCGASFPPDLWHDGQEECPVCCRPVNLAKLDTAAQSNGPINVDLMNCLR